MSTPPIILIAGPTGSGKSALALRVAQQLGGEVVGADSMQLYRDLRILSARPGAEEEARVPHHLVGVVDAAEAWSVGWWLQAAQGVLSALAADGKPAVVVGGTGLYFRALTRGLAEMPTVPTEAREAAETEYRERGEAQVRQVLRSVDPTAEARIAAGDRQRLVRAMAVARHTGLPLSHWQAETKPAVPAGSWRGVVVEPDRDELYRRCDARLEAMIEAGALDEVRALMNRGLSKGLPIMKAVGVREFARHLAGEISLDEALEEAKQATRNYAKRQLTWFRNQTPEWPRLAGPDDDVPIAA